jgi:hypothetical protein
VFGAKDYRAAIAGIRAGAETGRAR